MSVIAVPVIEARAVLDTEKGEFVLEARLKNGQEVRFASKPSPETIEALVEALTAPEPEPESKPKRARRNRAPKETPSS